MEPVFRNYQARKLRIITTARYIAWDISNFHNYDTSYISLPNHSWVSMYTNIHRWNLVHTTTHQTVPMKPSGSAQRVTLLTYRRWPGWTQRGGEATNINQTEKVFRSTKDCLNCQAFVSPVIIINYNSTDTTTTNSLY
jgi:hypothetical protein